MVREERVRPFCQALLKLQGVLLLLYLRTGFIAGEKHYIINTTSAQIKIKGISNVTSGKIEDKTFHGPNNGIWNYSVAAFNFTSSEAKDIFHEKNKISIRGTNALSVIVQGNFTVGTDLDVSGKDVSFTSNDKQLFWLGGFIRMNKTCCTLGAGPGGAFSYHGGGHGGRGGGFYQDRNTTRLYGWNYFDTIYLLGGSTGTNLFSSKAGSGGGAIELKAIGGTLTLNAAIKADGYSTGNTSDDHCAGGSSGGLIRLQGNRVVIGKNGSLSAVGGDSGFSSNHSHYCGGGGGGGVIQVFSQTDIKNYQANSLKRTNGGRGLRNGEAGQEQVALYFDRQMDLKINTTSCKMSWTNNHEYAGEIEQRTFEKMAYNVCKIEFSSSIRIGRQVSVKISGKRALSLISMHGSIEIFSQIDIDATEHSDESLSETSIGGYVKVSYDDKAAGPAGLNCSSDELYGRDFDSLLGGSVCSWEVNSGEGFKAVGGGALELRAESGAIVIDETISANGFSNNSGNAGAMGGTIRLHAKEIHLKRKALLTARGSGAGGGVVQLRSDVDVDGLCESKFNVKGKTFGLVNILVSTKATNQAQYIQDGYLEIDTTNARWMHKLATMNGSMAYSYYGEIKPWDLNSGHQYNVSIFEFQTPILINGSTKVSVFGLHSFLVKSKEGIYIGVDINLKESIATLGKRVGGYCVTSRNRTDGKGPGRGQPGKNAGAGHGGKGGLLFEDNNIIYGKTYGIQPEIHLIGGSTGTSNCSSNNCTTSDPGLVIGCGGGAIEIFSEKNLTIDAVISANGETITLESKASMGGSSGGTIILRSEKHVILGDNARLEATGANAYAKGGDNSIHRGGGGGGVIAIISKGTPVGIGRLSPNENTAGGNGSTSGDNGLVVINGTKRYGYPAKVIEVNESYEGCVNGSNISNPQTVTMKAHEASPSKCIEICRERKSQWAYVRERSCKCSNSSQTSSKLFGKCNKRCWSNSSLVCGGDGDDAFSAYKTGYVAEFSYTIISTATLAVFTTSSVVNAISPNKTVEVTTTPTTPTHATTSLVVNAISPSKTIEVTTTLTTPTHATTSLVVNAISPSKTIEVTTTPTTPTHATASLVVNAISPSKTVEVTTTTTTPTTPTTPTHATDEAKTTEETKPTDEPTTTPPDEPSGKFKDIANVTITDENVVEVVNQLKNLTKEGDMNGGDTKVALGILQKITSNNSLLPANKSGRQKIGQSILHVASSLLSGENAANWGVPTDNENKMDKVTSQTQVLKVIEKIGLKIGEKLGDDDSLVVESENIAMGVETKIPDESSPGVKYPRYDELGPEWRGQDRVFVNRELFDKMAADNSSRTTVVYAIYNQVSEHFPTNTISKKSSESLIVNSRILALKFNKPLLTPLKTPIKLWFDKLEKGENVTKPSCSFVDFESARGSWSHKGCRVVKEKDQNVECACDHLTNFAILMQVKEFEVEPDHYKALTVITYVGCGISLFGLALTLATFLSLETLASERTSIHKNLVVAIGLAQIIFLAGIDATYNPIACKAVALFLHYLYTAAFTWMLCEGVHLYSKVVEVFSEGSKMKYYYALGWGLPLTIVFISACSRWGGYGNERACWISITDGLIWAFVAPVLIVMTINFVVMIMVIRVIIASVTSLQNPGNASQVRAGVKGMIVLLPLLGVTWVFGLLAINKDTIAFQYLFAILNSLQGLFIFAFHCIGNTEVRVAYKRLHEKRTLAKSLPEHSLSSTHHMSSRPAKKRMDSHETNFTGDDDIIVTKTIRSVSDVKISGDNLALQTFGDTDSGRWSLNCPSPDPFVDLDHIKRA